MSLPITIDTYSLRDVERTICDQALSTTGSIVEAAKVLGITQAAYRQVEYPVAQEVWGGGLSLFALLPPGWDA